MLPLGNRSEFVYIIDEIQGHYHHQDWVAFGEARFPSKVAIKLIIPSYYIHV